MVRLLTSLGYTVESFSTGLDALAHLPQLSGEPPNVLVLDVSLPGIDGRELASEIRLTFPNLPVLLISGAAPLHGGSWLVGERNHFLAKPFTKYALARKLRKALA